MVCSIVQKCLQGMTVQNKRRQYVSVGIRVVLLYSVPNDHFIFNGEQ